MALIEHYRSANLAVSFELFPPKSPEGMESLRQHVRELAACRPAYMTCTYGAGGSTRGRTLEVLQRIMEAHPALPVASHLTCVGATQDELRAYLQQAHDAGVAYIVALRGDPPKGQQRFEAVPGGLQHANELVALIKREFPAFGVIVAGYPETHPEALSPEKDLHYLKMKVDAGAEVVITQLCYDNDAFFRFRDRCDRAGIQAPIVPGVLPITRREQIKPDRTLFGAAVPEVLAERMHKLAHDEEGQFLAGVYFAARQVEELVEGGVPGVHFYVLNKSRAAAHLCRALTLGV